MCGILDIAQSTTTRQEVVEDIAYVAVDDGLEDDWSIHIFGSKEFRCAISMKAQPKLCSVETSIFS